MPNRLAASTSPYLLQHADNPVDWWEWGEAAFTEARRRDLPILLSIGYAACHWCHVMAHESFEDDLVAELLNSVCIPIKLDREERPDVDAAYMAAATAMTGHGGWPLTAFLTPDGRPFHAGTYYPKPTFLRLLTEVRDAWSSRRGDVDASAEQITDHLRRVEQRPGTRPLDDSALARAVSMLAGEFDSARGGFGHAPKFPPSMVLEFLLRHHARTGDTRAREMAETTLIAMANGGIHDQVGGGFARYSVDGDWLVPHFEKMLYDNALLLRAYTTWHRVSAPGSRARRMAERLVTSTAEFLLADLRTPQGAFASSLDADTSGVEGLTYVWTPAQLAEVLGADEGAVASERLGVTPDGTFEHGTSTLRMLADVDSPAPADAGAGGLAAWWSATRAQLAQSRAQRPQPGRDDKVITSWNGLTILALSEAAIALDRRDWRDAAREAAELLLRVHLVEGRLRRASKDGRVGSAPGMADDHGNLAAGLFALHQATMEPRWLEAARAILELALTHFRADDGGFHDTADDAERLYLRPESSGDNAEPSGQSALAAALITYGATSGSAEHLQAGEAALAAGGALAAAAPRFGGWTLAAAEALAAGPLQVAIATPARITNSDGGSAGELLAIARSATSPGLVVAHGSPDTPGIPLLADRPLVDGRPTAYVCRGFVCDAPITDPGALRQALAR